jgi:Protein of unknown function (DUF2934)
MLDNDALIRERAYAIWEASGCPPGRDQEYWFQAANEIASEHAAATANNPVKRVRRSLRSAAAVPVRRKK